MFLIICFLRNVQIFEGKKSKDCQPGGRFFNQKRDIKEAVDKADKALVMSVKERLGLVVCIASDDEEEEEMDVESKYLIRTTYLPVG